MKGLRCVNLLHGCYSGTTSQPNVDKIHEHCQEGLFSGKFASIQCPSLLDHYFPYYPVKSASKEN